MKLLLIHEKDVDTVTKYLKEQQIEYKESIYGYYQNYCPVCGNDETWDGYDCNNCGFEDIAKKEEKNK